MDFNELRNLKRRERRLLAELTRLKKKEKHELDELKDEILKLESELNDVTRKISILEPQFERPNFLVRFWRFLQEDSWQSWLVSLVLLVILIRFVFFPLLSLATGSTLPLVVIESCSMYHETSNFDDWWNDHSDWYEKNGIKKTDFREFPFKNGLNKGDIIVVWGYSQYEIGDIIIFEPNLDSSAPHPIIHRIVAENPYQTKGDHNFAQLVGGNPANPQNIDETNIYEEQIIGKSVLRIPYLGWIKLIFFEPFRTNGERGLCG
jgi:hypothetical protein